MAQKMWSLFNSNQILNYLNQVLENQAPITIWQSSTQQLFQLKGNLTVVDEKKCTVSIAENDFELHDSEGIYFHCEGVDIIFKREKFSYSSLDNSLTFKTPSELMLKEKRRIDRFRFKYQDFKDVTFLYGTKSDEEGEKKSSVTFTLIDLSIAGLGCIGERKQVDTRKEELKDKTLTINKFEIRVRNRKDETIEVVVGEQIYGDWEMLEASKGWEKKNSSLIEWKVKLIPNEEKVITYSVQRSRKHRKNR